MIEVPVSHTSGPMSKDIISVLRNSIWVQLACDSVMSSVAPQVSLELSCLSNCCHQTVCNVLKTYKDYKSNWALHIYNVLKMYQKNGTKEFLARNATPNLMQYICVLAQQCDGSKLGQNCRNQLATHAKS